VDRVVLLHDGLGGLANQLRVAACVFAFSLYTNRDCFLPCFFRFRHYFESPPKVGAAEWFRRLPVSTLWQKRAYQALARVRARLPLGTIVSVDELTFLPPTPPRSEHNAELQQLLGRSDGKTIYLNGWLLRNPDGLKSYRDAILKAFAPRAQYVEQSHHVISRLRRNNAFVVGIHWRQGDYATWAGGRYLVSEQRLRRYLDAAKEKVAEMFPGRPLRFLVCTDGQQPTALPSGCEGAPGPGTEMGDLHALSMTDWIVGSHSTYGRWASYYGNVPITIMTSDDSDCDLTQELG
jgi:hypothetical protein